MLTDLKEVIQFPALIISTPRSGSTALLFHIKELYPDLQVFNEPGNTAQSAAEFHDWLASGHTHYVVKSHVGDLPAAGITDELLQRYYTIRLFRHDVISQIASFYVSTQRKKYFYTNYETRHDYWRDYENTEIDLIPDAMMACCQMVADASAKLIKFGGADLDIVYEHVQDQLYSTGALAPMVVPKPKNYEQIKLLATELLSTLDQNL